ncbi:MAG TPA: hypothetical protein VNN72_28675 [Polyangiaceae bacterium]|nr:hypothetical protein [Polyangiaceae bacterium]
MARRTLSDDAGGSPLRARALLALSLGVLAALVPCAACSSDDSESDGGKGGHAGSGVTGGVGGQPVEVGGGGSAGAGDSPSTGGSTAGGTGGAMNRGGSTSMAGSMSKGGSMNAGGTTSTGGSTTGGSSGAADDAGMTGTGATGTQPLGGICSNDGNCSDSEGAVVCCRQTCTLAEACPTSTTYLPCESAADCAKYGGGKLCCEVQTSSDTMRFCTKQSACSGKILP